MCGIKIVINCQSLRIVSISIGVLFAILFVRDGRDTPTESDLSHSFFGDVQHSTFRSMPNRMQIELQMDTKNTCLRTSFFIYYAFVWIWIYQRFVTVVPRTQTRGTSYTHRAHTIVLSLFSIRFATPI